MIVGREPTVFILMRFASHGAVIEPGNGRPKTQP
jgi:hypothetical protein